MARRDLVNRIFTDFQQAKAEANKQAAADGIQRALVPICASRLLLVHAAKTDVTLALYLSGEPDERR